MAPLVDIISEFDVITNAYSADDGRVPGVVVSVNTRGGTNQFHGAACDYVRNGHCDSFDYIPKQATQAKREDNQKQYGGGIGGPILLPHGRGRAASAGHVDYGASDSCELVGQEIHSSK